MDKTKFSNIVRDRTGKTDLNRELVRVIGCNKNTASARLSGKQPFKSDELEKLRIEYGMTDAEVIECFVKEGD